MDLEQSLEYMERKYGRTVMYNSTEQRFYEKIDGKTQPVRIETHTSPSFKDRHGLLNVDATGGYGLLSDSDLELVTLINDDVDRIVHEEMAAKGLMTRSRTGSYISTSRGVCHDIWSRKKQVLKEKYDLNWKSPQDLNPDTMFD